MKGLRFLLLCLLLFAAFPLAAQPAIGDSADDGNTGTITVKKKQRIAPYIKIEYRLTLARVTQVEVLVPVGHNLPPQRDLVPVYDSSSVRYPDNYERIYPEKTATLSRYFSQNLSYEYAAGDTLKADTMYVGMWIGTNGKIRYVAADTSWTGEMPYELKLQLQGISESLRNTEWGKGGGYKKPKEFLKPQEIKGESYYCELFIIVSSYPLTVEQKRTGARFAPFDFPLNSPPLDEQQRQFMELNSKPH